MFLKGKWHGFWRVANWNGGGNKAHCGSEGTTTTEEKFF